MHKEFCKGCGILLRIPNFLENLMKEGECDYQEFADGKYCNECAKVKKTNFKNKR